MNWYWVGCGLSILVAVCCAGIIQLLGKYFSSRTKNMACYGVVIFASLGILLAILSQFDDGSATRAFVIREGS